MTTNDRYFRAPLNACVDQRVAAEGRSRERVSTHKFSIRSQQSRDQRRIKTFDANDSTDESKHPSTGCHERVRWVVTLVCVYFVVGSAVTKVKMKQKQEEGIAEARGGFRGPGSVWGSGTAGILCALAAITGCTPVPEHLWGLGFVQFLQQAQRHHGE